MSTDNIFGDDPIEKDTDFEGFDPTSFQSPTTPGDAAGAAPAGFDVVGDPAPTGFAAAVEPAPLFGDVSDSGFDALGDGFPSDGWGGMEDSEEAAVPEAIKPVAAPATEVRHQARVFLGSLVADYEAEEESPITAATSEGEIVDGLDVVSVPHAGKVEEAAGWKSFFQGKRSASSDLFEVQEEREARAQADEEAARLLSAEAEAAAFDNISSNQLEDPAVAAAAAAASASLAEGGTVDDSRVAGGTDVQVPVENTVAPAALQSAIDQIRREIDSVRLRKESTDAADATVSAEPGVAAGAMVAGISDFFQDDSIAVPSESAISGEGLDSLDLTEGAPAATDAVSSDIGVTEALGDLFSDEESADRLIQTGESTRRTPTDDKFLTSMQSGIESVETSMAEFEEAGGPTEEAQMVPVEDAAAAEATEAVIEGTSFDATSESVVSNELDEFDDAFAVADDTLPDAVEDVTSILVTGTAVAAIVDDNDDLVEPSQESTEIDGFGEVYPASTIDTSDWVDPEEALAQATDSASADETVDPSIIYVEGTGAIFAYGDAGDEVATDVTEDASVAVFGDDDISQDPSEQLSEIEEEPVDVVESIEIDDSRLVALNESADSLSPDFAAMQNRYVGVWAAYQEDLVTSEQLRDELSDLSLTDNNGNLWMMGAQTGEWYIQNVKTGEWDPQAAPSIEDYTAEQESLQAAHGQEIEALFDKGYNCTKRVLERYAGGDLSYDEAVEELAGTFVEWDSLKWYCGAQTGEWYALEEDGTFTKRSV